MPYNCVADSIHTLYKETFIVVDFLQMKCFFDEKRPFCVVEPLWGLGATYAVHLRPHCWLGHFQRLCSLGFYGALEICILLLLLLFYLQKPVPDMTYNVFGGTLNLTLHFPFHC